MNCCRKKKDETREVVITIHRKDVMYEIRNLGYVEGDVMDGENGHRKHQMQDIGEDGNVDRVTRIMDLAFAECCNACGRYAYEEIEDGMTDDDAYREETGYVLRLKMPRAYSQTGIRLLTKYIHEYMVDCVMAEWTELVNPESTARWREKCAVLAEQISVTLAARYGVMTRPTRPF